MATSCFLISFSLLLSAAFLLTCESKVLPSHRVAGVFMLIDGEIYTMNFTAAAAACRALNVTLATSAQMERAVQLGLETCKYGWIEEKVGVIPRLKSDKKCGRGKTGVVTWFASQSMKFGAFCFNASDLEDAPNESTAHPQIYTSPTQTWTPTTALKESTCRSQTSTAAAVTTEAPEPTSVPSVVTLLVETTASARIPSTSPPFKAERTAATPTSRSQLTTSKASVVPFTFSAVTWDVNVVVSSEPVLPQSVSSAKPSLGATPTALITLGIFVLLLTAAGAAWYFKLKRKTFTCWSQGQQKDDVETEMWKHIDSETDLHSQDEEEQSDRMYSSDITLCVNPNFITPRSE
ncbi:hypothetical protein Q5P01_012891 [Channa striata]|uniref:Link domain-containing protein n=1 Tax=Channa striata TaxID=64152 RepID=A0AA88SKR5_CHASR|nr:hypothetical protein Q5P01_012891 [Channa striata]